MTKTEEGATSVATRVSLVLDACAASDGQMLSLADLVTKTGLPKTTLHRLCWKLVELGILEWEDDEGFGIGTKLYALGSTNPRLRQLRMIGMPHLRELVASSGRMANLALLSDDTALIAEELPEDFTKPLNRAGNTSVPLHATAVGKVLLSGFSDERLDATIAAGLLRPFTGRTVVRPNLLRRQLEAVRHNGVSISQEEWRTGVTGVAAPVIVNGTVFAAVGVVGHITSPQVGRLVQPVRRTAIALGRALEEAGAASAA